MLLIKYGRVVDSVTKTDKKLDVLIEENIITKVAENIDVEEIAASSGLKPTDIQVIDASGLVVAPGLVDAHVHFRDPGFTYKEDIYTGGRSSGIWRIYDRCLYGKYQTGSRYGRNASVYSEKR